MGAVWLRGNTPSGPTLRPHAWKLSVMMSFIVAIAMLHSTFLKLTNCTKLYFGCSFFYTRGKDITTAPSLSSGACSDFRRMFWAVGQRSPKIADVHRRQRRWRHAQPRPATQTSALERRLSAIRASVWAVYGRVAETSGDQC